MLLDFMRPIFTSPLDSLDSYFFSSEFENYWVKFLISVFSVSSGTSVLIKLMTLFMGELFDDSRSEPYLEAELIATFSCTRSATESLLPFSFY